MVTCVCCGPVGAESRAASGIIGVASGETLRSSGTRPRTPHPVAAALIDLAHGYIAHKGRELPLDVASRHDGAPGPGWLLCVAIVHDDVHRLAGDTLELATAAQVPTIALGDCVDYVFLAAALFTGYDVEQAVEVATSAPPPSPELPPVLCGETIADALTASVWALTQLTPDIETLKSLAPATTPGVMAAVGGVLGLRRRGSPSRQHPRSGRHRWDTYAALVPDLLRVRHASGIGLADNKFGATS